MSFFGAKGELNKSNSSKVMDTKDCGGEERDEDLSRETLAHRSGPDPTSGKFRALTDLKDVELLSNDAKLVEGAAICIEDIVESTHKHKQI